MAWTTTDLANIESAIASGELEVTFSDGRSVRYRSIEELVTSRDLIKGVLAEAGSITRPVRHYQVYTTKGF